ncbi:MAG TPA: DnaA/Hda family protein [Acidimicrobiales bacterium]|nr:DnaA/Hda family protein [Acidimicrobiales bacterium]
MPTARAVSGSVGGVEGEQHAGAGGQEKTFSTFVEGLSNSGALKAARRFRDLLLRRRCPGALLISGPSGCGKSHLLRAIGSEVESTFGPTAVRSMTAEQLLDQAISNLRTGRRPAWPVVRAPCRLFVLDQAEDLARGRETQWEVALWAKSRVAAGTAVLIASCRPLSKLAAELSGRRELRTVQMLSPSQEEIFEVLRSSARMVALGPQLRAIATTSRSIPEALGRYQRLVAEVELGLLQPVS